MEIQNLGQDRFLRKDPNQSDQTKDPIYTSANPAPRQGDDSMRKAGRPKGSEEDNGAPNILTGTVIVSCFIQTSALPSRIEMQGNDLTFFDDTYAQNEKVIGDTSRLIFTHGSGKRGEAITEGFILEKRASVFNTYDNVLSWYALPAKAGAHNYLFIGRNAYTADLQDRNVASMHFAINTDSDFTPPDSNPLNGVFEVEYSVDNVFKTRVLYMGNSASLFPGAGVTGYSALMIAGEGGITGFGYTPAAGGLAVLLYVASENTVSLGAKLIPDADGVYDIGSVSARIRNLYMTGALSPASITTGAITATDILASTLGVSGAMSAGSFDTAGAMSAGSFFSGGAVVGQSLAVGTRTWTTGSGSPEGVVTAPIGSLYTNTAGGAATTLYVKTSGAGNTGWTAK